MSKREKQNKWAPLLWAVICVGAQADPWARHCFYTLDLRSMTHAGAPTLSTLVCLILMRRTMKWHSQGKTESFAHGSFAPKPAVANYILSETSQTAQRQQQMPWAKDVSTDPSELELKPTADFTCQQKALEFPDEHTTCVRIRPSSGFLLFPADNSLRGELHSQEQCQVPQLPPTMKEYNKALYKHNISTSILFKSVPL